MSLSIQSDLTVTVCLDKTWRITNSGFILITHRDAQATRQTGATTMPSAQTRIRTANAAGYLARLCGHLSKLSSASRPPGHGPRLHARGGQPAVIAAEHTHDTGTVTLSWGQLTLHATDDELTIRADAGSQENLQRIQDMTAGRLTRFGRREHLDIQWTPVAGAADEPPQPR
jgi:hypothetical protein